MHRFFNVLIGGFRLFRINHMDIVICFHAARIAFHFVSIKYKNQRGFFESLIITQNIHQFFPGAVDVGCCQFFQILPGKDDVIAVHQQIFFLPVRRLFLLIIAGRFAVSLQRIPATLFPSLYAPSSRRFLSQFPNRTVGALKDLFQFFLGCPVFFILFFPVFRGHRLLRLRLLTGRCIPATLHMHIVFHLIPVDHKPGTVCTKDRSGRILKIGFRIVSDRLHDIFLIVARIISF